MNNIFKHFLKNKMSNLDSNITITTKTSKKSDKLQLIYVLQMENENLYSLSHHIPSYKYTLPPYYIKIGFSSISDINNILNDNAFSGRMSSLQTGNPFVLKLIYLFCFENVESISSIESNIQNIAVTEYGALKIENDFGGDEWFVFLDWKSYNHFIVDVTLRYLLLEICDNTKNSYKFEWNENVITNIGKKVNKRTMFEFYGGKKINIQNGLFFSYDNFRRSFCRGLINYTNKGITKYTKKLSKIFFIENNKIKEFEIVNEFDMHIRYIKVLEIHDLIFNFLVNYNEPESNIPVF
jgi:hypothetical protein